MSKKKQDKEEYIALHLKGPMFYEEDKKLKKFYYLRIFDMQWLVSYIEDGVVYIKLGYEPIYVPIKETVEGFNKIVETFKKKKK